MIKLILIILKGDFMKTFIIIIFLFLLLFLYCSIKVASDTDRESEDIFKNKKI